ncbi:MAG: hypothetical protein M1837_005265 [Sclerophora amabilis]|nr:MAG: hypothetical protein M1837_005265 [Sclerophora amabilis]
MKRTFWKYKLKAWGEDDIKPVTGGFRTSRNGWGAFIVDCATTLPLMGLWQELHLEIDHIINKIDFTNATELVDPFETTIRYLGGLVSLTNLIDDDLGPEANITKTQRDQLLAQAVTLARKLEPSFDSPTGMVWPRVNFTHDIPAGDPPDVLRGSPEKAKWKHPAISPARAGSNILENGALSKLTGDGIYLENATKAWAPLVWNKNPEEWPGIIDGPIDIFTGTPVGRFRSWDAPHDSYYEYLIKAHIFSPGSKHARKYRNRWVQAAESLREHLSSRANSTGEGNGHQQLYIGSWDDGRYVNTMHHFSCFAAGNLLLGGRYLGREDLFTFGLELLDSCHHIYTSTTTHIGPDAFHWIADATANHTAKLPTNTAQASMLKRLGFWSSAPHYTLRPEYVESVFYAWRITGEEKYRDWAWEAFTSIEAVTRARYGYGGLHNVFDSVEDASLMDYTESFWGGETLKYDLSISTIHQKTGS